MRLVIRDDYDEVTNYVGKFGDCVQVGCHFVLNRLCL